MRCLRFVHDVGWPNIRQIAAAPTRESLLEVPAIVKLNGPGPPLKPNDRLTVVVFVVAYLVITSAFKPGAMIDCAKLNGASPTETVRTNSHPVGMAMLAEAISRVRMRMATSPMSPGPTLVPFASLGNGMDSRDSWLNADERGAFRGRRHLVRPLAPDDFLAVHELVCDPAVASTWRLYGAIPTFRAFMAATDGAAIEAVVAPKEEPSRVVGYVTLDDLNPANRVAYLSIALAPLVQRRSSALAEALFFVLLVSFRDLGPRKVYMETTAEALVGLDG